MKHMQIIDDKTELYLKSPMPDACWPRSTQHNIKPQQRVYIPRKISCHSFRHSALLLAHEWARSPSKCSIPASAVESLESIKQYLKMAEADRDTLWQMPLFSLLAQSGPDPYRRSCGICYSGLWLAACMMILSRKLTPPRVGLGSLITCQARREWQLGGSFTPVPMDKCS